MLAAVALQSIQASALLSTPVVQSRAAAPAKVRRGRLPRQRCYVAFSRCVVARPQAGPLMESVDDLKSIAKQLNPVRTTRYKHAPSRYGSLGVITSRLL